MPPRRLRRRARQPAELTLFSWNIMNQRCADRATLLPPFADRSCLAWEYRLAAILVRIERSGADVLCLQEVDVTLWPEIAAALLPMGYRGVLQGDRDDPGWGVATAWREDRFRSCGRRDGSRTMIVVLQDIDCDLTQRGALGPRWTVVNVHLEGKPSKSAHRTRQLESALRHAARLGCGPSSCLLIAGDFNSSSRGPCCTLLRRATTAAGARAPEAHPFTLKSAYDDTSRGHALLAAKKCPTYWSGVRIDHIWFASNAVSTVDVCATVVFDEGRRRLPRILGKLPNARWSSDHLPVQGTYGYIFSSTACTKFHGLTSVAIIDHIP